MQYFMGFELLRKWMIKHHSYVDNFANLDFEAIDTEILTDETKEKEDETFAEATDPVEGDDIVIGGTVAGGVTDETHMDVGQVKEVVNAP